MYLVSQPIKGAHTESQCSEPGLPLTLDIFCSSVMAGRRLNTLRVPVFASLGKQALYALIGCSSLLLTFVIWRWRAVRAAVHDPEKIMPDSSSPKDPAVEQPDLRHHSGFPSLDGSKSVAMTSEDGRCWEPCLFSRDLAAKAGMESSRDAIWTDNDQPDPAPAKDAEPFELSSTACNDIGDKDQQAPWRRHSYPSARSSSGGVLHRVSQRDETKHFRDPHGDPGIVWRRRTMVFGTEEPATP